MGDFNVALNMEDTYAGSSFLNSAMREFKECVSDIEVMDVTSSGHWNTNIEGHNMFKVMSKLKLMKKPIRKLLRDQGNLHDRVNLLRIELDTVQKALDSNPDDLVLREEECVYLQAFNEAKLDEERFLKQKAKVEWLDVGDSNSTYFHKTLKSQTQSGADVECNELNMDGLFSKTVHMSIAANMVHNVMNEEIKYVMFDIEDEKAPGPDGFTSIFFKKGQSVVGDDICNAGLKRCYHKKKGLPRCAFKIDIQKAYDTVDWHFLENILTRFRFHPTMVKWIMACVTSSSFSLSINGNIHGYFKVYLIISVIMDALKEFKLTLGLVPSLPKSTVYFCNVSNHTKNAILNIMPFSKGELPVKYLGVPLISSRFLNKDCKAKVSWDAICLPKCEGGLGLRNLYIFNYDLMTTHIWNIISYKESLWLREVVIPFFWVKLENGMSTSLWYDRWSDACPLINFLSPRDIHREGFHLKNVVADLIVNGTWAWPLMWLSKAPDLGLIVALVVDMGQPDASQWRDRNGNLSLFSVAKAWEAIRAHGNQVTWSWIVWFSHNIPRHAFHLWLVMRNRLKTHDRVKQWDIGPNGDLNALRCALCESQPDSHPYLFFECVFFSKVWSYVCVLADMDLVPPNIHDIILYLQPLELLRRLEDLRKREVQAWLKVNVVLQPRSIVLNLLLVINTNLPVLGVQTQSHIGKIIISKLTYKLGGLLLLLPIGFRMEPQLGLYVRLCEILGLRFPTIDIRARLGPVVEIYKDDISDSILSYTIIYLFECLLVIESLSTKFEIFKEQEGSILFGIPGSRQQKFLVLRFFDVKEQQGIDRLNIEKLDGNIVQKHRGLKQVGFKQLGPGVETGVYRVHAEKRVWFKDKQPKEKTNTDCLVKEQKKEYQTGWKIKTATGFKTPIDMLGFFGWLASIKHGMLELVKVKCIFLGYRKGTGSMQVLQGDEFKVEPQDGHTFEVEPHGNVDHVVGSQKVQTQDLIYYHPARDRDQHSVWELFNIEKTVISKWKAGLKDDMDARSDVYVLSNGYKKCSDDSDGYYWESTPVQTLLKGHYILSLEGSLSGDCDMEKNDVGMLDKFDRGLQTDVQKEIWLKGLLAESGYELSLVAGIAIGALVKGSSRSKVPAQVEGAAYRY
ncbi:putative reverse transcriptase domain, reverse transcriptase zinc-binding domain protein [Tanacetum coccineum]